MKISTWAASTGAAMLTAAALMLPALPATAAPAAETSASDTACTIGEAFVHGWLRLPEDLRADLRGLSALSGDAKWDAARAIHDKAIDGGYGAEVQDLVRNGRMHRWQAWSKLPQQLKSDLADVRAAAKADRPAMLVEISDTALAGDYGPEVQASAERIRTECAAE